MKSFSKSYLAMALLASLGLTACGSGGSSNNDSVNASTNESTTTALAVSVLNTDGTAASNTQVCIDLNNSGECDENELSAYTDSYGNVNFTLAEDVSNDASIIAIKNNTKLKSAIKPFVVSNTDGKNAYKLTLNALTYVLTTYAKLADVSMDTAKANIAASTGLDISVFDGSSEQTSATSISLEVVLSLDLSSLTAEEILSNLSNIFEVTSSLVNDGYSAKQILSAVMDNSSSAEPFDYQALKDTIEGYAVSEPDSDFNDVICEYCSNHLDKLVSVSGNEVTLNATDYWPSSANKVNATYTWTLPSGQKLEGEIVSYEYAQAGIHEVVLDSCLGETDARICVSNVLKVEILEQDMDFSSWVQNYINGIHIYTKTLSAEKTAKVKVIETSYLPMELKENIVATIDYGDGTVENLTLAQLDTVSHVYADNGTYDLKLNLSYEYISSVITDQVIINDNTSGKLILTDDVKLVIDQVINCKGNGEKRYVMRLENFPEGNRPDWKLAWHFTGYIIPSSGNGDFVVNLPEDLSTIDKSTFFVEIDLGNEARTYTLTDINELTDEDSSCNFAQVSIVASKQIGSKVNLFADVHEISENQALPEEVNYKWYINDIELIGENSSSIMLTSDDPSIDKSYTVKVVVSLGEYATSATQTVLVKATSTDNGNQNVIAFMDTITPNYIRQLSADDKNTVLIKPATSVLGVLEKDLADATVKVDFGDGTVSEFGFNEKITHTYATYGSYTVTLDYQYFEKSISRTMDLDITDNTYLTSAITLEQYFMACAPANNAVEYALQNLPEDFDDVRWTVRWDFGNGNVFDSSQLEVGARFDSNIPTATITRGNESFTYEIDAENIIYDNAIAAVQCSPDIELRMNVSESNDIGESIVFELYNVPLDAVSITWTLDGETVSEGDVTNTKYTTEPRICGKEYLAEATVKLANGDFQLVSQQPDYLGCTGDLSNYITIDATEISAIHKNGTMVLFNRYVTHNAQIDDEYDMDIWNTCSTTIDYGDGYKDLIKGKLTEFVHLYPSNSKNNTYTMNYSISCDGYDELKKGSVNVEF